MTVRARNCGTYDFSQVEIRTGLALSKCAMWIDRISRLSGRIFERSGRPRIRSPVADVLSGEDLRVAFGETTAAFPVQRPPADNRALRASLSPDCPSMNATISSGKRTAICTHFTDGTSLFVHPPQNSSRRRRTTPRPGTFRSSGASTGCVAESRYGRSGADGRVKSVERHPVCRATTR